MDIDLDDNDAVDIAFGGTNATTAADARTNLGLGTAAVAATGDFEAAGAVATHAGLPDPHTGYMLESNIGVGANNYPKLGATPGTPDGTKFYRDDNTWAVPATGDSLATSTLWDAAGDLVQGTGANTAAKLTKGAEGTLLRAGATSNAYTTATFASTYAAGTILAAVTENTVTGITEISLGDSAAQFYDATDDTKKVLLEVGGLPTSTTAQMSPIEYIHVTVVKPQDLADAVRDMFVFWSNDSGKNFVIQGWKGWSGGDNTSLVLKTCTASGGSIVTVDAIEIATDGTNIFYASDTTITSATIANGNLLFLDFDDTDDPAYVKLTIYGYYAN